MYLLDTNVISEMRKPKPHGGVVAWVESVQATDLHVSAVTIGEIQAGIEITRKQDPGRARELSLWLDDVVESWSVLPMDANTFREWAVLMNGKSNTLYEDAMIAATAKLAGMTVITRNVRDYKHFDVKVQNPFLFK